MRYHITSKANELIEKFETCIPSIHEAQDRQTAKQCAIQHIAELVDELEDLKQSVDDNEIYMINNRIGFYLDVRAEINKL